MSNLGKIEEFSIRKKFSTEASFNKYLSNNLDILNKKLRIDLSEIEGETEVPVGRYRCDITGGMVAIETQFGDSDHNHLGKLLLYFSNQDVKIGIWICENARAEHIKAVQWLNERSEEDEEFYLLEVKMIRIGDSLPAVDFDLIVGPNFKEIGKLRRKSKGESLWRTDLKEIGEKFLVLKPGTRLSRPGRYHIQIPTAYRGIHFEWLVFGRGKTKKLDVTLHIETRDVEMNKKIIEDLLPYKEELERAIGEEVHFGSWSYDRETRWSKIAVMREFGENMDEAVKNWAAETMVKMYDILYPNLSKVM